MKRVSTPFFLALTAAVLIACYFIFWPQRSVDLTFRARVFPEGFRELVLESASSPGNPVLGSLPGPSAASNAPSANNDRGSTRSRGEVCDALFRDPGSPIIGNPQSKVGIAVFTDYRCPYCKTLSKILIKMSGDERVHIIYREWPILGRSSELAARAALAAAAQGKYLPFHTRLMKTSFIPNLAYIKDLANELGMDGSRFLADMNSAKTTHAIQRTTALAKQLGFVGSPVLVVGRTVAQGAITQRQLESLIEDETSQGPSRVC